MRFIRFEQFSSIQRKQSFTQNRDKKNRQQKIYQFYLKHIKYINNWDLVDSSAHKIIGVLIYLQIKKETYFINL